MESTSARNRERALERMPPRGCHAMPSVRGIHLRATRATQTRECVLLAIHQCTESMSFSSLGLLGCCSQYIFICDGRALDRARLTGHEEDGGALTPLRDLTDLRAPASQQGGRRGAGGGRRGTRQAHCVWQDIVPCQRELRDNDVPLVLVRPIGAHLRM